MSAETETLQNMQLDADQAWEYLQSKGVPNLDIERPGKDKVTLVELLAEFANGVYIGRDETDYEEVAEPQPTDGARPPLRRQSETQGI